MGDVITLPGDMKLLTVGGSVDVKSSLEASNADPVYHKFLKSRGRACGDDLVPLADVLINLWLCWRRPSKAGLSGPRSATALRAILKHLELKVEASTDEAWWNQSSCLILRPLQGQSRARHLSQAFKEACVDTARETSEAVGVRDLLSATNCLQKAGDDGALVPAASQHSERAKRDHCLGILAATRKTFKDVNVLHICVDGITAAGRHNDIFIALDPSSQTGTIPPIKATIEKFKSANEVKPNLGTKWRANLPNMEQNGGGIF